MSLITALATAIALGIWTALQPCPIATNLAAISYLGRRVDRPSKVVLAGLLFALGQAVAYVGLAFVVLGGMTSAWRLSTFLQENATLALGPLWILAAMVLLGIIRIPLHGVTIGVKWQARVDAWGLWSALPLGVALALAFCPASATCFFVSLLTLLATHHSRIVLPIAYAIGSALPVVVFAVVTAYAVRSLGRVWNRGLEIERWLRCVAGVVLLVIGVHFSLRYNFNLVPPWDPLLGALQGAWSRALTRIGGS
jgi:cytochrome c biogenesis protein CcdA